MENLIPSWTLAQNSVCIRSFFLSSSLYSGVWDCHTLPLRYFNSLPMKNFVTSTFSFCSNSKRIQGHSFLTSSPKTNKTSIYFKNNIQVLIALWKVILPGLWVHFYGYIRNLLYRDLLLCYPRYGKSKLLFLQEVCDKNKFEVSQFVLSPY